MIPKTEREQIIALINREVVPAIACTEPIAVALCVAKATETLGCRPEKIQACLSANILKNAMGVGIPGTGMIGLPIAISLGVICGVSSKELKVLELNELVKAIEEEFGVSAAAMAVAAPAAGAAAGVTLGTVIGLIYLIILHKVKGDNITKTELANAPKPEQASVVAKNIIKFAIPVALSSLVFSITNLIDSITIQNRLEYVIAGNLDFIRNLYATELAGILDADIKNFLYGSYSLSLDFRNLIPSLTMTLGISAIPTLSAAWAVKNRAKIKVSIESVLRVTMLVAMPCGIGMGVLAQPILAMFYGKGESASGVSIAAPVLTAYGFSIFLMALSQPMTNMLQALDRTKIPLVSLSIGALVKLVSNFIFVSIPSLNVNGAVIGTILCYVVIVAINLFALVKTTRIRINLISVFAKPIICGILCGVAAYTSFGLCNRFIPEFGLKNIMALGVGIGFGGIIYIISMLFIKGISKDDVVMLPKGEKIAKILAKYGFIE